MTEKKCIIMRPPKFVEAAKTATVVRCSSNGSTKDKLGRFFVGDNLISTTLQNGLVILAKKLSDGRTTKTRFDSAYSDDDLDCGLELDFYKDKTGFFKKTELRVKIDFTSVANFPREFSTKTVWRQVSFSSFYTVRESNDVGVLALSQIKLEGWRPYTNEFSDEQIELKFYN